MLASKDAKPVRHPQTSDAQLRRVRRREARLERASLSPQTSQRQVGQVEEQEALSCVSKFGSCATT